ncbi:LysR family transcriptional regulator, partial [Mesorhizobium sp. M4B.F.Ca.ET.089.01.1.1]|uniref:LysR family transcriptional regulator n=1 Tax=Mesorhizobium sp. M4B.F.Ca.ET.089.01.1.1 TaxID=2496662 RepID=UPI001FDF22DF
MEEGRCRLSLQKMRTYEGREMELLQSGLKLRQLQVFRAVLRAGSTRQAAIALGISQPAVSQH